MNTIKIRIAAKDDDVRGELKAAVARALLGEEVAAAAITETHRLDRPRGDLEPDVTSAALRIAGSFIVLDGVPASGKSALAVRIGDQLHRIRRGHTIVTTRVK